MAAGGARRVPWAASAGVLALGIAATVAIWSLRTRDARDTLRDEVSRRAVGIASQIEQRFAAPVEMLHAVASLIGASGDARADLFTRFVRDAIGREPLIYALEWAPRVTRDQREAFEADARADGMAGYEIREPGRAGLVRAADRDVYFPLRFLVPMNAAWGYDFRVRPMGRLLADRACTLAGAAASTRYQLVEDPPAHYSVYAIEGVWAHGIPHDPAERCATVLGYVIVILRFEPILADVLHHVDLTDLELAITDVTRGVDVLGGDGTVLGESAPGAAARADGPLTARVPITFVDRAWELAVSPSGAPPRELWILALGASASLLAAALVGGLLAWWRLRRELAQALRLGQYQVEAELGRGGMGVVFRARHVMLRRETALKLLSPSAADAAALARFEREVRLTAELVHPNTIQIFDYGRTPDGRFYYAMELLDGLTFQELIDHDGAQPVARTVHLVRQIAGALREAHGIGLVHRDLKPGNLMLTRRGGIADFVKVLDFGLVTKLGAGAIERDVGAAGAASPAADEADVGAVHADAAERDGADERGVVLGTPGYVAPEALRGGELDQRADLYGLGAVWYGLLAGHAPFLGDSAAATVSAQLRGRPAALERLRGDLPAGLASLVLRCMNPDPRLRVPSAQALLDEIDALVLPAWTAVDADRWWRERAPAVRAAHRDAVRAGVPAAIAIDTRRLLREAARGSDVTPRR